MRAIVVNLQNAEDEGFVVDLLKMLGFEVTASEDGHVTEMSVVDLLKEDLKASILEVQAFRVGDRQPKTLKNLFND